jgi:CDP-diacylglycerol--serine O-phosphatidyltransferase
MHIPLRRAVPSLLTLGNALCGAAALALLVRDRATGLELAVPLVVAGWGFDLCDGLAARLLDARSELGRHLDSLADAVTFCTLPAVLVATMGGRWWSWVAAAVYLCAGLLRLARFDLAPTSHTASFLGLPSPAAALLVVATLAAAPDPRLIAAVATVAGLLMISRLAYADLPKLYLSRRRPAWHVALLAVALVVGPAAPVALVVLGVYALGPLLPCRGGCGPMPG